MSLLKQKKRYGSYYQQSKISIEDGKSTFKDSIYNELLEECEIKTVRQVFPYSKNDTLKRLYEVFCDPEKIPILLSDRRIECALVEEDCEIVELSNIILNWYLTDLAKNSAKGTEVKIYPNPVFEHVVINIPEMSFENVYLVAPYEFNFRQQ